MLCVLIIWIMLIWIVNSSGCVFLVVVSYLVFVLVSYVVFGLLCIMLISDGLLFVYYSVLILLSVVWKIVFFV